MVYQFKMSDSDIINTLRSPNLKGEDMLEEREWLQEQCDTVRANPRHFKQFVSKS